MSVHPFTHPHARSRGTIHVMRAEEGGSSWGSFAGPFVTGRQAIDAAHALNRREYEAVCHIAICPEAMADAYPCDAATAHLPRPTPTPSQSDLWEL